MADEQNNNTGLTKINKMKFGPGGSFGLGARVAEAQKKLAEIDVNTLPNRLALVFDDSGSMSGDPIQKAKEAVDAFSKTCNPADTAIGLFPMNAAEQPLTNDMMKVAFYCQTLRATNGTPMYSKLYYAITNHSITRSVVFSDGAPSTEDYVTVPDNAYHTVNQNRIIELYKSKGVPIDTVFIGKEYDRGFKVMQELAEMTGGIFLHFTDASVLAKSLKYLAPRYRALLANAEIKDKVQKGEMTI